MIRFDVEGEPVPQPRPRVYRGKSVLSDTQRSAAYKGTIAIMARQHIKQPLLGPIKVTLVFVLARPLSEPKTKRLDRAPHAKDRGDIDNFSKTVLDALNGVAWVDDCQVYSLSATKWVAAFEEQPHTSITIESLQ